MTVSNSTKTLYLLNFLHNPYGYVFAFDLLKNELITLRRGGRVVEFMGMVKGGKSKQIKTLREGDETDPELIGLKKDSEINEFLGRPIEIQTFKPNSLIKVLYEKDEELRAIFNETIIHLHGTLLGMLSLYEKEDLHRYLRGANLDLKIREIDLAILDRGPNDDAIWTNALYDFKKERFSAEERDYHLMMAKNLERHVHLAIGMNVPPEVAQEREKEREGRVMNLPFLRIIYANYHLLAQEAEYGNGQPTTIQTSYESIDGTEDYVENAKKIYRRVKGLYIPQDTEELRRKELEGRLN